MVIDWDDPAFEKRLLEIYSVTEDPDHCAWILPDGRMLHLYQGPNDNPVFAHNSTTFVLGIPVPEAKDAFTDNGAIRHVHSHRAIFIRRPPTVRQIPKLASLLRRHFASESWLHGRTQLSMGNDKDGFYRHYGFGTNPAHIMDDVFGFFGMSGQ